MIARMHSIAGADLKHLLENPFLLMSNFSEDPGITLAVYFWIPLQIPKRNRRYHYWNKANLLYVRRVTLCAYAVEALLAQFRLWTGLKDRYIRSITINEIRAKHHRLPRWSISSPLKDNFVAHQLQLVTQQDPLLTSVYTGLERQAGTVQG